MRILLTGATGQIGWELASLLREHDLIAPGRSECDLTDSHSLRAMVREARPALIINPAAYTAVDRAESEPGIAHAVNALAPAVLGEEARRLGVPLVHFSTDYVFNGEATTPYSETAATGPVNVYGQTKLEGEQAIAGSGCVHIILRTSWVYARRGKNFLLTIERLARERTDLTVIADHRGTPNWARDLARAAVQIATRERDELSARTGVYHLSSGGATTWHGFATAIVRSMHLENPPPVAPINSSEYPTAARRPVYSVLDPAKLELAFGLTLPPWQVALAECQQSQ
ncbi:MAG: dTDP-4-dehydrorhamnose reductase [Betaproteobacteria bacterium]